MISFHWIKKHKRFFGFWWWRLWLRHRRQPWYTWLSIATFFRPIEKSNTESEWSSFAPKPCRNIPQENGKKTNTEYFKLSFHFWRPRDHESDKSQDFLIIGYTVLPFPLTKQVERNTRLWPFQNMWDLNSLKHNPFVPNLCGQLIYHSLEIRLSDEWVMTHRDLINGITRYQRRLDGRLRR